MLLEGSCHCRKVLFRAESDHYYPYQLCYCSICRKTNGSGGYGINLKAKAATLEVEGEEFTRIYQAQLWDERNKGHVPVSEAKRVFCGECGSGLWIFDPNWPDLIHPFASAIDSPLPQPPERTHIFVNSKASWVEVHSKKEDKVFSQYPDESIAEWHDRVL